MDERSRWARFRDRFQPAEERPVALWLAGTIVVSAALTNVAHILPTVTSFKLTIPRELYARPVDLTPFLWDLLAPGLIVLALWLAVSRLRAPRLIVGFSLLSAATGIALGVLRLALALITVPVLARLLSEPAQWARASVVLSTTLSQAITLVAVALLARALSSPDQDLVPRLLDGAGLAEGGLPRRLAVSFVLVPAVVSVVMAPVAAAVGVMFQLAFRPDSNVNESWVSVVGYAQTAVYMTAVFLAVWFAVRRYRAPRSVWLTFVAAVAAGLLFAPLSALLQGPPDIDILARLTLQTVVALVSFAPVSFAALAAVAVATRGEGEDDGPGEADRGEDGSNAGSFR